MAYRKFYRSRSAKQKFKVGDRVRMSKEGKYLFEKITTGVITGFSKDQSLVYVLRDGTKNAARYHINFWTKSK